MGGHPAGGAGRAEALGLAPTIPRDRASAAACIPTTVHVPEPVSPNGRGSGRCGPAGLHPDLRGTVAPGVVGVGASHDASPGGPGELRHRRRAPNTSGRTGSFRGAELANMARNAQARYWVPGPDRVRHHHRRAAAVRLVRSDRGDERRCSGRRHPDPAPPVRPRPRRSRSSGATSSPCRPPSRRCTSLCCSRRPTCR